MATYLQDDGGVKQASPQQDDAQRRANGLGIRENSKSSNADATDRLPLEQGALVRHANLVIALAKRGYALRSTKTGTFIVSRWGRDRELRQKDLARFSRMVGVTTADGDTNA